MTSPYSISQVNCTSYRTRFHECLRLSISRKSLSHTSRLSVGTYQMILADIHGYLSDHIRFPLTNRQTRTSAHRHKTLECDVSVLRQTFSCRSTKKISAQHNMVCIYSISNTKKHQYPRRKHKTTLFYYSVQDGLLFKSYLPGHFCKRSSRVRVGVRQRLVNSNDDRSTRHRSSSASRHLDPARRLLLERGKVTGWHRQLFSHQRHVGGRAFFSSDTAPTGASAATEFLASYPMPCSVTPPASINVPDFRGVLHSGMSGFSAEGVAVDESPKMVSRQLVGARGGR